MMYKNKIERIKVLIDTEVCLNNVDKLDCLYSKWLNYIDSLFERGIIAIHETIWLLDYLDSRYNKVLRQSKARKNIVIIMEV